MSKAQAAATSNRKSSFSAVALVTTKDTLTFQLHPKHFRDTRAREAQADKYFQEIIEIADAATPETVNVARLRVDRPQIHCRAARPQKIRRPYANPHLLQQRW